VLSEVVEIDTRGQDLVDLTARMRAFCSNVGDGLLNVFVPHATAGLAIIELGDSSEPDFAELIERLLPKNRQYSHSHGSPGHGADHLTPTVFSPSLVVPVLRGEPQLGTWQYVVLVDRNADNPMRRVRFSFVGV
jgi:secondary thiamine-phosphate synthase enzyme